MLEQVDYDDPRDGLMDNTEPVDEPYPPLQYPVMPSATKTRFTWRIENFSTFCDILQHRKIFSKYAWSAVACLPSHVFPTGVTHAEIH